MQELDCRFGLERRVWAELLVRGGPHLASCFVLLGTDGHTTLLWPSIHPVCAAWAWVRLATGLAAKLEPGGRSGSR